MYIYVCEVNIATHKLRDKGFMIIIIFLICSWFSWYFSAEPEQNMQYIYVYILNNMQYMQGD